MTSKEHGVRAAYDDVADLYADHFRATEAEQPVDVAMIEHFVSLLTSADGARPRVLDAGCGAGRMLPLLARFGADGQAAKPPTVYRALEFLERQGMAHRIASISAYVACSGDDQSAHASEA